MKIATFTLKRLRMRTDDAAYIADLRACAEYFDEHQMAFDLDKPCWTALREKWRVKPKPRPSLPVASDDEIAALFARDKLGGCGCDPPGPR